MVDSVRTSHTHTVDYGDFSQLHRDMELADTIHIDIANDGDVFEFAIKHYLPLLSLGVVMLLEGGSPERQGALDRKYAKRPINPVVTMHGLQVIGRHPALTIVPAGQTAL